MEMDPSTLIREIRKRPLLWDHKHINYHNRNLSDTEWVRVAQIVGNKKEYIKQKWKSLRDNYRKELKKYRKMEGICSDEPPLPKWSHFQEMSFLTGVIAASPGAGEPLTASDLVSVSLGIKDEDSSVEMTEDDSYDGQAAGAEMNGNAIVKADNYFPRREAYSYQRWPVSQPDDNGDLHFLKSLVPFMKMLPPLKKLQIRSEFHNLLIKEISELENGEANLFNNRIEKQGPTVTTTDTTTPSSHQN